MKENTAVKAHRALVMGRRVSKISQHIAALIPKSVSTILDVGAGTGEMAIAIKSKRPELEISGVDVFVRPKTFVPISKYDGKILPFADNSFDLVVVVDVLHHCDDPVAVLQECARVAKRYVLIKDHNSNSLFDEQVLRFMDWVGNRAHKVALPYDYLSTENWLSAFKKLRLKMVGETNNLHIYPMPFDLIFGGDLHCLFLLEK